MTGFMVAVSMWVAEFAHAACFQHVMIGHCCDGINHIGLDFRRGVDRAIEFLEKLSACDRFGDAAAEDALVIFEIEIGEISVHRIAFEFFASVLADFAHFGESHGMAHEGGACNLMPYCPPPTLCFTLLLMPMTWTPSGNLSGG